LIWSNIGSRAPGRSLSTISSESAHAGSQVSLAAASKLNRQVNVDCSGANRGLFSGILVLVLTVISIIVFFIYLNSPGWKQLAVNIQHVTQIALYIFTSCVVITAAYRFKDLR
jgi:hypothetical protein